MARSGRFGRLPSAAPDLTSQIVSLMEQWQAARDREIMDAWEGGGKFEGKKVTDRDMLKYYKKRRDSYQKDDPEWNQWDNDMWQLRFRISNEDVMMNYRMGKIGPRAVAAHYRSWAQKMPKDSSYYRNLMQSYGDFMKAAKANAQSTKKAFDYNGMLKKIDDNNKDTEDFTMLNEAISIYARSHGFLDNNETIDMPGVMDRFSSADLSNLMMNVQHTAGWDDIKAVIQKRYPEWDGTLTWAVYKRAANAAIQAHRENIKVYKSAPFDTRSLVAGERGKIKDTQHAKEIPDILSADDEVTRALAQWNEWRQDSVDGKDLLRFDSNVLKALEHAKGVKLNNGDEAGAGAIQAAIYMVSGDVENAVGVEDTNALHNLGFSATDIENNARGQKSMKDAIVLVQQGKAVWEDVAPTADPETMRRLNLDPTLKFTVVPLPIDPNTGRPQLAKDDQQVIATPDSEGVMTPHLYDTVPIIGADGKNIGMRVFVEGDHVDGFYEAGVTGGIKWNPVDMFDGDEGLTLVPSADGLVVTQKEGTAETYKTWYAGLQTNMNAQNVGDVLDNALGAGATVAPDGTLVPAGGAQGAGAGPSQSTAQPDEAYAALQRVFGPDQPVPAYGDLPNLDNALTPGFDTGDPKAVAKARMDFLRAQVPAVWVPTGDPSSQPYGDPNVDSPEAQEVWIRSWIRQNGGNVPWSETDKKYLAPDGTFKPRITAQDKHMVDNGFDSMAVQKKQAEIDRYNAQPQTDYPPNTVRPAEDTPATGQTTTTTQTQAVAGTPGASETAALTGGATGRSNIDPISGEPIGGALPTGTPQVGTTGSPVGQSAVRDNVAQPTWGTAGGFQQFWARGGGETSTPPPDIYNQSQLMSIVAHTTYLTSPESNPHFFSSLNNAYWNGTEERAREAAKAPQQVFLDAEAINHQQTDARMQAEVIPETGDLIAFSDMIPILRKMYMSGADITATSVAAELGDTITRGRAAKEVSDLTAGGYDTVQQQDTPRWSTPDRYAQGGLIGPFMNRINAQVDRGQSIERMRPQLPSDIAKEPKQQPGLKLANNLAQVAGIGQPLQKVDAKVPYVQTLSGVRFESPRIVPARVADIGVAKQAVGSASIAKATPAAQPQPANTQSNYTNYGRRAY